MRRARGTLNHSVDPPLRASGHIAPLRTVRRFADPRGHPAVADRTEPAAALSGVGYEALVLLAQPFDRKPHSVPGLEVFWRFEAHADPRGCPGRDHVTRQQGHELADIADNLVDPEDQIGGVAALTPLTVDFGPHRQLGGI